ncbi:MAG: mechanosensitive ion channel family protein [Xenococcaceae cyanobacterium MO_207.B15]|nr:mechanosensitive ion channel family protein [Xenococcaceae cyanobacterium MO_207.B15]
MTFLGLNGLNIEETANFLHRRLAQSSFPNYVIFLIFVLLAIGIGQIIPNLLKLILDFCDRKKEKNLYNLFVKPIRGSIKICSTLILIYWAAQLWLKDYQRLSEFLEPLIELVFFISIAWIVSRILRQFIRFYGIKLLRQSGLGVNEMLLVFETLANIAISFITVVIYAQIRNFSWVSLFAGISLGGAAIGLAVSKTADDFLGTILLYLDRRFLPGEYIRLPILNSGRAEEIFGRVETIGWRSTTIRIAGKNTLYIVSNALLAADELENVSRGKKVMVLIYLDFMRKLKEREQALIEQVIIESTEKLFGIDPNSTSVNFSQQLNHDNTRAMVTFSILGSTENSIELRKNILESTYEEISVKLRGFAIEFVAQEPNIYVEAPITI